MKNIYLFIVLILISCNDSIINNEIDQISKTTNNVLIGKWDFIGFETQDYSGNWSLQKDPRPHNRNRSMSIEFYINSTVIINTRFNKIRCTYIIDEIKKSILLETCYGTLVGGEDDFSRLYGDTITLVESFNIISNLLYLKYNEKILLFEKI